MAEPAIALPFRSSSDAIAPLPPGNRAILRCRPSEIGAISARLDLALPTEACTSSRSGDGSALWLGPDEWLLLGRSVAALADITGGIICSLVDVSHRQVALSVTGRRAEAILASSCALDLTLSGFPIGMCTRTMYAKAEIVLWRIGETAFHVEMWRSFARYVEALLREAEFDEAV